MVESSQTTPQFNISLHFMSNLYGPSQILSAINLPKLFIATVLKSSDLHNHMIQDSLVSTRNNNIITLELGPKSMDISVLSWAMVRFGKCPNSYTS